MLAWVNSKFPGGSPSSPGFLQAIATAAFNSAQLAQAYNSLTQVGQETLAVPVLPGTPAEFSRYEYRVVVGIYDSRGKHIRDVVVVIPSDSPMAPFDVRQAAAAQIEAMQPNVSGPAQPGQLPDVWTATTTVISVMVR